MSDAVMCPRLTSLQGTVRVLAERVSLYYEFFRNSFLIMLAYRMWYFSGIIGYLLFVCVHYFIWQAVYAGQAAGARINGFSLSEMITYICVGWVARSLYYSNVDYDISELVRTGQISNCLIRPVHFHTMIVCQGAGEALFRLLFFTVPIGLMIVYIFPVAPPANGVCFLLFGLSTAFSFLILTELSFIVGMLSFRLKSIQGIIRAKYFLVQFFSGLLLPLTFFPSWLKSAVDILPFKDIAFTPLQFYLGRIAMGDMLAVYVSQFVWWVVLAVLGQLMWKSAIAKLTLQGG
jgi:ABC-2 type transport system permease protein